jgi:hypothetical protein
MASETTKKLLWGALSLALVAGGIGLMVWVNDTARQVKATSASEPPAFLAGTPPAYLHAYVQGDFAGQRLEAANWVTYKERVIWPVEPNWEKADVIRGFRMQSGPTTRREATIEVTYDVLGELNLHTFTYKPAPERQVVPYLMVPRQDRYRIGTPMVRPHVGVEAAIAHLERMRAQYKHHEPNIQKAIAALKAEAAASPRP